ncbi:GlxA family transcriptional regulator [Mesorhizobium sp. SP-1A]|uniref:GlxA family transcriptional regulator n=1 Tax=Mesorhizobium sp. SP-1A TaxID=3077840 RepID=UPI0028F6E675|nr:GlxA family transcriptional regulator [Mesorhizobium sp. SP-1A]
MLPAFSLQSFSSAVEVLMLANEVTGREEYGWRVVSADGKPVPSSCKLPVAADTTLLHERSATTLVSSVETTVIVCGDHRCPVHNKSLEAWLRECRNRRTTLVGIGGGSIVLARAGLAEGRRCAIHWELFPAFSELFPGVRPTQCAFECDRDLYTCSGGVAAFDMFLRLVERDQGTSVANRICEKAIAWRARSAGDRQRSPRHSQVKVNHEAVIKIIEQMEANLGDPLGVDSLAVSTGLSRRQIERLFERELGRSPARYYLAGC